MFLRTVRSMDVRAWIILFLIAFVLSFAGVFGCSYGLSDSGGSPTIPNFLAVVLSLVLTVPVGFVLLLCNAGLTKLAYASLNKDAAAAAAAEGSEHPEGSERRAGRLGRFVPQLTVRSVALFTAIMLVFWMPYIVIAFPGQSYNDTMVQMQQVYEDAHPLDIRSGGNLGLEEVDVDQEHGNLSDEIQRSEWYRATDAWLVDHHPFALTLVYGGLAWASDALFGDWMAAFIALMVVQVLVLASELTFCAAYLRRKGAPLSLCFASYLFCCLLPLVPLGAITVVKDTAFTLFFVPWFLMLMECVFTKGTCFARKRMVVAFVLLAVGMCLTKKTGVYVVGATALFGLVASVVVWARAAKAPSKPRGASRGTAVVFFLQGAICALLMFAVVPFVVFPALNIVPGSQGEALGVLLQQTARVYRDAGSDALTPEERQAVAGVMHTSGLEWRYAPTYTDRVKGQFYLDATGEQMRDYLGAYVSMGLRFPESYMASVIGVASRYLAPVRVSVGTGAVKEWTLAFDDDRWVIGSVDWNQDAQAACSVFLGTWSSIPVLNIPLAGVTYCLWIPALLLFFCLRNRLRAGLWFVPFAVVTIFCIIGPVYDIRYAFPEVVLALGLLGALVAQAKIVFKERAEARAAQSA